MSAAASLRLRVGGGFAILVAGALGVALPLLLAAAHDAAAAPWLLRTKAFAAGVVLSLAVVHLLNEALESFSELAPGASRAARRGARGARRGAERARARRSSAQRAQGASSVDTARARSDPEQQPQRAHLRGAAPPPRVCAPPARASARAGPGSAAPRAAAAAPTEGPPPEQPSVR
jgi:hypothetical protein